MIPSEKIKAIIKYFCGNTNPRFLGKTKLMKLFYFLDFLHIKRYGVSVTGDKYYHLGYGPIPTLIKNLVDDVDNTPDCAILSDTIEIVKSENRKIYLVKCINEFLEKDKDYFSVIELKTMEDVCRRFKDYTTKQIVEASHKESSWRKTGETKEIPYILAADDSDCLVEREDIELLNKII